MTVIFKLKRKYFPRFTTHRSIISRKSVVAVLLNKQKLSRAFIGQVKRANLRGNRLILSFKIKQIGISKIVSLDSPLLFRVVRLR